MGEMRINRVPLIICFMAGLGLAGCDETGGFSLSDTLGIKPRQNSEQAEPQSVKTVERDVEAPDVFSVTEAGLWDGRPSLGGVWVAHPDVGEPERVMIRNNTNGKFVVGALFRRERDIPGPRLQISSDAAASLGMLAGAPSELNVVALRREEVVVEPPAPPVEADAIEGPAEVSETPLDPIAAASAAIEAAPETEAEAEASDAPLAQPANDVPKSRLEKPYIQVGIFSIESNANRTADQMRSAGLIPTVRKGESNGKPFWRVVVGPAVTSSDRNQILSTIKSVGFTDAYAVTN